MSCAELGLELPAEAVDGHLHGAFGRAEPAGNRGVSTRRCLAEQARLQLVELGCARRGFPFLPQVCEHALDHRQRPPAFVERFRRGRLRRFVAVASFGVVEREGEQR